MSGRVIRVRIIDVSDYSRGRDYVAQELHSTKGWRAPFRGRAGVGQRPPKLGEYFPSGQKRAVLFAEAGRLMRGRNMVPIDPKGSTRHLQRHGWYRRQQRKLEVANA